MIYIVIVAFEFIVTIFGVVLIIKYNEHRS